MSKAFAASTLFRAAIGIVLVGLAAWGSPASAGSPESGAIPPGKPVRSTVETASAGRRPLAVRIAMADKLKTDPPSTVDAQPQQPSPPAEPSAGSSGLDASPERREQAAEHRDRLLGRVRERIAAIAEPPTAAARPAVRPNVPRLQVECQESTIESQRGDMVTWVVTVRNTGAVAHGVLVTLYFAEGIEPTAAVGGAHKLAAGEVRFNPIETLGPDDAVELQVTGKAVQPGAVAYRVEVGCREVPGNVAREAVILVRPQPGN